MMAMDAGATAGAADHAGRSGAVPTLGAMVFSNPAPGYALSSQGGLDASAFASDAPDPSLTAGVLASLGDSVSTYERTWRADGGLDRVQDLLVRFPDPAPAEVFLQAAQRSLQRGEIVSSDPLASIPGAHRVTYFTHDGIGQAITMRSGAYVDLLSIMSAAGATARPLSPATADRLAGTQYKAMARASGAMTTTPSGTKKGASAGTIGLAVIVVAIAAAAVAAPGLLRRRRLAREAAAASPPSHRASPPASAGDAVDDLREKGG